MYDVFWCLCATYLASSLGASSIFITEHLKEKAMSFLYGSAAGIMLAACFLSLLLPGIENNSYGTVLFFMIGVLFMSLLDRLIPHESALTHEIEGLGIPLPKYSRLLLTIALHNIPQGLALGLSLSGQDSEVIQMLVLALCLQNFPEGIATAIPLLQHFKSKKQVFLIAEALSFLEIPACILGLLLSNIFISLMDSLLGFAAGILLYTVIEEIIPDAWSHQNRPLATFALFLGFTLMMLLHISF